MKKEKKVVVYNEESPEYPTNPVAFLLWWAEKFKEIPEEYMDSAEVEIDAYSCYDSATTEVTIAYIRPETDEEERLRLGHERLVQESERQRELRLLAELKQKYGEGE